MRSCFGYSMNQITWVNQRGDSGGSEHEVEQLGVGQTGGASTDITAWHLYVI